MEADSTLTSWAVTAENDASVFSAGRPRSVLVVDDEALLRKSLTRVLTKAGYQVFQANDVPQAKKALEERSFDIILSDISMPGQSGLELLSAVRARGLSAPVLLMTGVPSVDSAAKAVENGAMRYLTKPFGVDELIAAVKEAVRQHDLADLQRQATLLLAEEKRNQGDLVELTRRFQRGVATIKMAFQPIVRPSTHDLLGFEALLRCGEPTMANPGDFLAAAERLGRLHDLGREVRRSVAACVPQAPSGLIFVNLHSQDLLDDDLYSPSSPLTQVAGRVVLEITERASLEGLGDVGERIRRLRKLGYRIAIDDLGAGYAGLSSAVELRPDVVKFDMSLVRGIDADAARRQLMGSMVQAFRALGVTTIGEGVETEPERDVLVELGCDALQGFLYARPGAPFPPVLWQ